MDWRIEHYKEKCTDPLEFLRHFRCTTEPIGGSTELDENGDLVDWDAAVVAIEKAREQAIEGACDWIKQQQDMLEDCFSDAGDFADLLKEAIKNE